MYNKYKLSNGLRVVSEYMPNLRSISFGIWVNVGARNENITNNGISHFIEHMLFKGTELKTAKCIAESMDKIGGQINAFTSKECTCYYCKTLDSEIYTAVDVLADMFFNSLFKDVDIELEKKVVLDEISMYEDYPEDMVHDLITKNVWNENSLGYPIIGNKENVLSFNRETIIEYMNKNYNIENCVIAFAGNFNEAEMKDVLEEKFGSWQNHSNHRENLQIPKFNNTFIKKEKETELVHCCMAFPGIKRGHNDLYALLLLNSVLGGGMSSKLFQKIREDKGLVYSIYSYPISYSDSGLFTIYAGAMKENIKEVIDDTNKIIDDIRKSIITEEELKNAKSNLKGNYMLGLEGTSARMTALGKSEVILGKIRTPDEILKSIDKVKMEDVENIVTNYLNIEKYGMAIIGNDIEDI